MVPDFDRIFDKITIVIVVLCGLLALLIRCLANSGVRPGIRRSRRKPRFGWGLTLITFFSLLVVAWALLYAACGSH